MKSLHNKGVSGALDLLLDTNASKTALKEEEMITSQLEIIAAVSHKTNIAQQALDITNKPFDVVKVDKNRTYKRKDRENGDDICFAGTKCTRTGFFK